VDLDKVLTGYSKADYIEQGTFCEIGYRTIKVHQGGVEKVPIVR
jgi:hypothetical protein